MFSPFSRHDKRPPVPEWANFFSQDEFEEFLEAVARYFDGLGRTWELRDGVVHTELTDGDHAYQNLGLSNVAQMCKQGQHGQYFEIVRNHFDLMRKSKDFIAEFYQNVDDFGFVQPFIGTRIYHRDHIKTIGEENVIALPVTDDMIAMLVFDMPQAVSSVKADQAAVWGKSTEELIALGTHNIRSNYDFDHVDLEAGFALKAVVQDHFFGSNILLDLDQHPELVGTHGSLIGVPHRHATLIYPIEDTEVIMAVNALIPMIHGMHREGPGSISTNLFWYRQGTFQNLPYELTDERISFAPTEDFVALLNYLSEEG